MKLTFLLFAVSSALLLGAHAWWETGHMLVAEIAKQDLLQHHPEIYYRAENISLFIKGLTNGLSDSFVESAVFLDDIKVAPWNSFFEWHFINKPYNPDGLAVNPMTTFNSIYALNESIKVLSNPKFANVNTLSKSIFMRVLIHVLGDAHQPLHSVSMYNQTLTQGDQGGNLVIVYVESQNKSYPLHSFWDAVAFRTPNDLTRPLNESSVSTLEELAQEFMSEWRRVDLATPLSVADIQQWTISAYKSAVQNGYQALREDCVIDQDYEDQAFRAMKQGIALGGYRLADVLYQCLHEEVYGKPASTEKVIIDSGF